MCPFLARGRGWVEGLVFSKTTKVVTFKFDTQVVHHKYHHKKLWLKSPWSRDSFVDVITFPQKLRPPNVKRSVLTSVLKKRRLFIFFPGLCRDTVEDVVTIPQCWAKFKTICGKNVIKKVFCVPNVK